MRAYISAVKDAMISHRLGAADQESLYFTSWKAAAEPAVLESLEPVELSDNVPLAHRKHALRYCTGSMGTRTALAGRAFLTALACHCV